MSDKHDERTHENEYLLQNFEKVCKDKKDEYKGSMYV